MDVTRLFNQLAAQRKNAALSPFEYLSKWREFSTKVASGKIALPNKLLEKMTQETGISPKNLQAGLKKQFSGWAQFSEPVVLKKSNLKVTIVAAGNVPGVAVAPAILLAAAGASVVVKQSSHEQQLLPWILSQFQNNATGIVTLNHRSDDPELKVVFSQSEVILVFGSDDTVNAMRKSFARKVIGFGHKFSFAVWDARKDNYLDDLAEDVLLFHQAGCLSVQAMFVLNWHGNVLEKLLYSLAEKTKIYDPNGEFFKKNVPFHVFTEKLIFSGIKTRIHEKFPICVFSGGKFRPEYFVEQLAVQLIPIENLNDLESQLGPWGRFLQGCCLAVSDDVGSQVKQRFKNLGVSYFAKPGHMQAPALDWPNGGTPLIEQINQVMLCV